MKKTIRTLQAVTLSSIAVFAIAGCGGSGGDGETGSSSPENLLGEEPVAIITSIDQNGSETILNGSDSYDPDGEIVLYRWSLKSGESIESKEPITKVQDVPEGDYVVKLEVVDNDNLTGEAEKAAHINPPAEGNIPPVADASKTCPGSKEIPPPNDGPQAKALAPSADCSVTGPLGGADITLDGSLSHDPDGEVVDWKWFYDTDDGGTAYYSGETVTVSDVGDGVHTYTLVVTDNDGAQSVGDEISIDVRLAANKPPTINGSIPDGRVQKSLYYVEVADTSNVVVDDDGLIQPLTYLWEDKTDDKYSGGARPTITNETTSNPRIEFSCSDDYGSIGESSNCYYIGEAMGPVCDMAVGLTVDDGEFTASKTFFFSIDYTECDRDMGPS